MQRKHAENAFALTVLPVMVAIAACGDDLSGPHADAGGVEFTYEADAGRFSASGSLALNDGAPEFDEWAVAAEPDSLEGVVVMAFAPSATDGKGDLLLLQVQPAHGPDTYGPCGPDEVCRGRLFQGWMVDGSGYDAWFEVVEGTVELNEFSATRIGGTFSLRLRDVGGVGSAEITIEEGKIDVPVSTSAGIFYRHLSSAVP